MNRGAKLSHDAGVYGQELVNEIGIRYSSSLRNEFGMNFGSKIGCSPQNARTKVERRQELGVYPSVITFSKRTEINE